MKRFYLAALVAAFVSVLTAGCASSSPAATASVTPPPAPDYRTPYLLDNSNRQFTTGDPSQPPRLTVGVSDPNTQLILPWFLNDAINLVNYR